MLLTYIKSFVFFFFNLVLNNPKDFVGPQVKIRIPKHGSQQSPWSVSLLFLTQVLYLASPSIQYLKLGCGGVSG